MSRSKSRESAAESRGWRTRRRQELIETWISVQRIDSLNSTEKIAHLTSEPSEQLQLSINDFEDRGAMLGDVRARISFLKRDPGALLASLPPVPPIADGAPEGDRAK